MKMNLSQTKIVGLTMELDLKTREYKMLCEKLEKLKEKNIEVNSPILLELRDMFQKNHNDIVEINKQIKELKINEDSKEKQLQDQYNPDNIFKNRKNTTKNNENVSMIIIEKNKNAFMRILDKIKKLISRK